MTLENQVREAGQALLDVDHEVHKAVAPDRRSVAVRAIGLVSEVGDQPQLRLLSGGVILLGVLRRDPRMVVAGGRMLMAHELATAAKSAVKRRIDRTRPRSADSKQDEKPQVGRAAGKEESSFPSGHSAGSLAVAAAFSSVYPSARAPALLAASGVALAQIPRCAHYPTDVGAGLAIGAAANGTLTLLWRLAKGILGASAANRLR